MNKNLQTVFDYHEQTKHSYHKYAKSLGYMDWANQPNPYRFYRGALCVNLPLALKNTTPPYHLLFTNELPAAPLLPESISQFLQFSMGLAAIKSDGINEWALRCNASSGNLHPSEAYLILPPMNEIHAQTTISHYAPKDHALEILTHFDTDIWENLPKNAFFVALSSIVYREVWKYGERAFRYTNLDAGHALRAIQISAKTLGWHYQYLSKISDKTVSKILGLDQKKRFSENEIPDMLLLITPEKNDKNIDIQDFVKQIPHTFENIAQNIAVQYQKWSLIEKIEQATFTCKENKRENIILQQIKRSPSKDSKEVILKRRSAQMMDKTDNQISFAKFKTLLHSTKENFLGFENEVNLVLFIHNVEDLKPGLYIFMRANHHLESLQSAMKDSFEWKKIDDDLYALTYGDFRDIAQSISCNQAIASDGAFSLGMICTFAQEIIKHGAHKYKELYWECGVIGQQLYLEATSVDFQATGIGCYLDDVFHSLLGLKSNTFQSLYHFTVGKALIDSRILSKELYQDRSK